LPGKPLIGDDGFAVIEAGTTLLGAGVTATTSGGLFGTFEFELIAELPDAGSPISVVRVEVNTSADPEDRDVLDLRASPLRVLLVHVFRNAIFNVVVERKHNGAALAWSTRLTGLDDIARLRRAGSESEFVVFTNPLAGRFAAQVIEALRVLRARDINFPAMPNQAVAEALRELLDLPDATAEQILTLVRRVRELDNLLQSRNHVILIPDLPGQTQFEFELVSRSLDGRRSPVHRGRFSTRLAPDLRPLFVNQFDAQVTRTGAAVSFGTNRPASATYILRRLPDGDIVAQDTLNENGETRTRIALEDLEPGVEYEIEVTASLIDADDRVIPDAITIPGTIAGLLRVSWLPFGLLGD